MEPTTGPIFRLPDQNEPPSREDLALVADDAIGSFRLAFGPNRWEVLAAEHLLRQAAEHAPYVGEIAPADERKAPQTDRPPPSSEEAGEPVEVAARCRGLGSLRGLPPEIAGALRDAASTIEMLLANDESEQRIPGTYKETVLAAGRVEGGAIGLRGVAAAVFQKLAARYEPHQIVDQFRLLDDWEEIVFRWSAEQAGAVFAWLEDDKALGNPPACVLGLPARPGESPLHVGECVTPTVSVFAKAESDATDYEIFAGEPMWVVELLAPDAVRLRNWAKATMIAHPGAFVRKKD